MREARTVARLLLFNYQKVFKELQFVFDKFEN